MKRICGLLAIFLLSCGTQENEVKDAKQETQATSYTVKHAKAVLNPTIESEVKGVVTFEVVEGGVRIIANIEGLTPGRHGFHIHEKGDCSAPDASSAGGHFNPTHAHHGSPNSPDRHVGDLGNIEADHSGRAHYDRVDTLVALEGDNNVIGRAVIIHSDADDYKTQPSGNSGIPVACGVIEKDKG